MHRLLTLIFAVPAIGSLAACGPACLDDRCSLARPTAQVDSNRPRSATVATPAAPSWSSITGIAVSSGRAGKAWLDGAEECDTPCTVETEPGEHVIAVRIEGLRPAEKIVQVRAGGVVHVQLTPSQKQEDVNVLAD
jgi:hypothetical protein